jgi:hypothetical protein
MLTSIFALIKVILFSLLTIIFYAMVAKLLNYDYNIPPTYVPCHLEYMACAKLGLDLDDGIDVNSSTQS